jgi:hypothetical protein
VFARWGLNDYGDACLELAAGGAPSTG